MAGEVESPALYKDGPLPRDSVSFGRFEDNSLDWEKKSSFTNNVYFEEVKKLSSPGSVTHKKYFLEAHLDQASFEILDKNKCRKTESEIVHLLNKVKLDNHESENLNFISDGEKSDGSFHREPEIMDTICEFPLDQTPGKDEKVESDIILELEVQRDTISPEIGDQLTETEKTENDIVKYNGLLRSSDRIRMSLKNGSDQRTKKQRPQELLPKVSIPTEIITKRSTTRSPGASPRNELVKKVTRLYKKESYGEPSEKTEREIQLHKSLESKQTEENGSEKHIKSKEVDNICPRISEKDESNKYPHPIRHKASTNFDHSDSRINIVAFKFKCDDRAQKRKDFYLKLEEKLRAKEQEMNQLQAKTKEEIEQEMKLFRKSLNFKATPLPSFYRNGASIRNLEVRKSSLETTTLKKIPTTQNLAEDYSCGSAKKNSHGKVMKHNNQVKSAHDITYASTVGKEVSEGFTTYY